MSDKLGENRLQADSLVSEARQLNQKFEDWIMPYRTDLWKYCKHLAKSPWDGEDLFQDTLLKSFAALSQLWQPVQIKSYLFRIATNTWIDQLRKSNVILDTYEDIYGVTDHDRVELTEAMELMWNNLPPRQVAVVLLMDVFEFTAKETASMIHLTEGAVYSALHRARTNLKSLDSANQNSNKNKTTQSEEDRTVIDQIVTAINSGNSEYIVNKLSDTFHNDASPGFQEFSKKDMLEGSFNNDPGMLLATQTVLWGKPVIVVQVENKGVLELHDIKVFKIENGQIVYHRGLYFCKEFLIEAGKALGIPVQLIKAPDIDWSLEA